MAKAKNLAALAGLAGLAYAMSNKGKDKEKGTTDSNPTRPARPEPTETRLKSSAESIAAADKSDKSTSISTKGAAGTTTPGPDKSVPNLDVKPTPVKPRNVVSGSDLPPAPKTPAADNTTAAAIPSGIMGGARQRTNTVSSSAEGMKNYKPRRTPATLMASGGRTVSKKELEESGLSLRDFLNKEKGLTRKAPEGTTREYKPRDASDQASKKSTSAESGASRGSRNFAGSGRGESGGANSDSLSRFNAGKEGYDEAGNPMKRGGAVKMASGGMTASRRADGIAQRGKTRGKMC